MVLVEESELSRIQRRTAMCERIQLKLQAFLSWSSLGLEIRSRQTNIVDDFGEIHDRRAVWRFNGS